MGHLLAVNVGRPRALWAGGRSELTAIRKRAAPGPVAVRRLGLDGDGVADTRHHGGVDRAVYAFAAEDLARWSAELAATLPPGVFGENLTTEGVGVNEALVGERWRVGTALLEVAEVRIPCGTFARWLTGLGHDVPRWVARFTAEARPGPYLRVLEEGVLAAGDPVVVEHRPEHDVTVSEMFRALTTERDLLPRLRLVEGLSQDAEARVAAYEAGARDARTGPTPGRGLVSAAEPAETLPRSSRRHIG